MQANELNHWSKIRGQGMLRYVLMNGLLCYGVPMFVVMTYVIPHPRLTTPQSAFLWALAGAGYGVAMWVVQERRFRKVAGRS